MSHSGATGDAYFRIGWGCAGSSGTNSEFIDDNEEFKALIAKYREWKPIGMKY